MTFIAHYDKTLVKYNVTVNYYDINEALLYTVTEKVAYGDSFKIVSPLLTGKVADKPYVLGVVDKAISIEVKYRTCDVWDGQTIATEYTSGSGTSVDPFIITTGAQLAYLAQQSNEQASLTSSADWGTGLYFKLNNDIDLSAGNWTPICYDATNNYKWKYFAGNFDGNGKIIN